jgi:hypothetical protein
MQVQYSRKRLNLRPCSPRMPRTYSLAHLPRSLAAVLIMLATMPAVTPAQSVSGAMAVAATILPPDRARAPQLISVSVSRRGIARLVTTAPIAGAASQIVMVTVSSPTNSFVPVAQAPMRVLATYGANRLGAATSASDASPAPRLAYEVDVSPPADSNSGAVSVRITYLIVPGT